MQPTSILWDVDGEQWETLVAPTIAALRALPDPKEPIECTARAKIVIFEQP